VGPGPHTVLACLAEPGRRGKQMVCPCFTPLPFSVELDAYGASLTCHVPPTYHEGSGVVRADKEGEAFTRQGLSRGLDVGATPSQQAKPSQVSLVCGLGAPWHG
jgi:hypothetical protein